MAVLFTLTLFVSAFLLFLVQPMLARMVLPRLGGAASAAVMASAVRAMPGFALSLLVLHLAAEPFGAWVALLAMLATSLLWSAGMLAVRATRGQPAVALTVTGVDRSAPIRGK